MNQKLYSYTFGVYDNDKLIRVFEANLLGLLAYIEKEENWPIKTTTKDQGVEIYHFPTGEELTFYPRISHNRYAAEVEKILAIISVYNAAHTTVLILKDVPDSLRPPRVFPYKVKLSEHDLAVEKACENVAPLPPDKFKTFRIDVENFRFKDGQTLREKVEQKQDNFRDTFSIIFFGFGFGVPPRDEEYREFLEAEGKKLIVNYMTLYEHIFSVIDQILAETKM